MMRIVHWCAWLGVAVALSGCETPDGLKPTISAASPATAEADEREQATKPDFWPDRPPPPCVTKVGTTRVAAGEARAYVDQAKSVRRDQKLAIAYNPKVARGDGTGSIAVWSDYDSPGFYRWVCKPVTDHRIEMVRNGMGAIIEVYPEPDGRVEDFKVVRTYFIQDFRFDIWEDQEWPDSAQS